MGFIEFIVVGLIAGWLAGKVMKGEGYGVLVDIILGILGGVLGGWLFGKLGIWQGGGLIASLIVAFIGAVILVWITRLIKKASTSLLKTKRAARRSESAEAARFCV
jgi:uncharacterized membrane protein YeaQ/YmgE (transglycosylase-associated protein family)